MKTQGWSYSSSILDLDNRLMLSGQLYALAALPTTKDPSTHWIGRRGDGFKSEISRGMRTLGKFRKELKDN
jgi:hypothetical protein